MNAVKFCILIEFILQFFLSWQVTNVHAIKGCSIFYIGPEKSKRAVCDSIADPLKEIPNNLPSDLVSLRIKNQNIGVIKRDSLSYLTNLTTLIIESSNLKEIHEDAFDQLDLLEVINLRNNTLSFEDEKKFSGALFKNKRKLVELNLSNNMLGYLGPHFFDGLRDSRLQSLSLGRAKDGRPLVIDPKALNGLLSLQKLDLRYSALNRLSPMLQPTFKRMRNLNEIYLNGNPWHCDCELKWLKNWFYNKVSENGEKFKYKMPLGDNYSSSKIVPVCETPAIIKTQNLFPVDIKMDDSLKVKDFMCPPEMLTKNASLSAVLLSEVNLTCRIKSDPKCDLQWYKDGELVLRNRPGINMDISGKLVIRAIQHADAGLWSCVCRNKMGEVKAVFNATVTDVPYGVFGTGSRQTLIYACVGITILIILLSTVGVTIVCCCCHRFNTKSFSMVDKTFKCIRKEKLKNQRGDDEEEAGLMTTQERTKKLPAEASRSPNITVLSPKKPSVDSNNENTVNKDTANASTKLYTLTSNSGSPYKTTNSIYNTNHHLTELGGPLIQEAASVGGNRLLVSCDGPEPTVLLATGLPFSQSPESNTNMNINVAATVDQPHLISGANVMSSIYATSKINPISKHSTLIDCNLTNVDDIYASKIDTLTKQGILSDKSCQSLAKNSCPLHGISPQLSIPSNEQITSSGNPKNASFVTSDTSRSGIHAITHNTETCPVHGIMKEMKNIHSSDVNSTGQGISDGDIDSNMSKVSLRTTKSMSIVRSSSKGHIDTMSKRNNNPVSILSTKAYNPSTSTLPHRTKQNGSAVNIQPYQPCPLHGNMSTKSRSHSTLGIIKLDTKRNPDYTHRKNLKARLDLSDTSEESETESTSSTTTSASDGRRSHQMARRKSCDYEETFDRLSRHSQMSLHTSSVTSSSSRPGSVTNSTVKAYFYPVAAGSKGSLSNSSLSLNRSRQNVHSYNMGTMQGKRLIGTPVQISLGDRSHSEEDDESIKSISTSESVSSEDNSQHSTTSGDEEGYLRQESPATVQGAGESELISSRCRLSEDTSTSLPNNQTTLKIRVKLKDPLSDNTSTEENCGHSS